MRISYESIAGQSMERLATLSDGVFAVAMTLMVLDLRLPAAATIHAERDLWGALLVLPPRFLTYLTSFLTLRILRVAPAARLSPHLPALWSSAGSMVYKWRRWRRSPRAGVRLTSVSRQG